MLSPRIEVVATPIDMAAATADIVKDRTDLGAVVTFTGICRDEGGALQALELEHYPGMAEAEIRRIADEAADRFDIGAVTILHRHGKVVPGEIIVLVATASTHRRAAFDAAAFIMDFLKTKAPFWKKEHLAGGPADWVSAKDVDEQAEARWNKPT